MSAVPHRKRPDTAAAPRQPQPQELTDLTQGQKLFALFSQPWNALIMREILFGTNRFGELQRALGIAPNVLTGRLNNLIAAGQLERRRYRDDKPWYDYYLTEPAAKMMPAWTMIFRLADTHLGAVSGHRREIVHTTCGQVTTPILCCEQCGQSMTSHQLTYRHNTPDEAAS